MDCASIRCSHCKTLLTLDPPLPRFLCTECPLVPDQSNKGEKVPNGVAELCQACFENSSMLHEHAEFCKITSDGAHVSIHRAVGQAARHSLHESDFPLIPPHTLQGQATCAVCFEPFSAVQPAVGLPGCTTGHSPFCQWDGANGLVDRCSFYCRDCALATAIAAGQGTYCGLPGQAYSPPYCQLCEHGAQRRQWLADFTAGFALICSSLPLSPTTPAVSVSGPHAIATAPTPLTPAALAAELQRRLQVPLPVTVLHSRVAAGDALLAGLDAMHPQAWIQALARQAAAQAAAVAN